MPLSKVDHIGVIEPNAFAAYPVDRGVPFENDEEILRLRRVQLRLEIVGDFAKAGFDLGAMVDREAKTGWVRWVGLGAGIVGGLLATA